MAERRFELALRWLEENPDVPDKVSEKLQNLYAGFAKASTSLSKLGYTGKQNDVVFKGLQAQYRENYVQAAKGDVGFKLLSDTLDAQEDQAAATRERWEKFGRSLRNTGVRLGWLGYRMTIVGRMMLRWLEMPIKKVTDTLTNWQKTLGDTAQTLGLLEYFGMGSATTLASLKDIIEKLPEVALKFNAAMGALNAIWARIAVDIGPILTGAILKVADAFFEMWDKVSPTLIPALQTLVDRILPPLLDLLKEAGPALIEGFVNGLSFTIPLMINLLDAIKPILPTVATLIGAILPLAPLLIAIGTAAYLISPVLMSLGSIITFLASGALIPLITAVAMVASAIAAGVLVFLALKDVIGPIPALIAGICTAVAVAAGLWYLFGGALTTVTATSAATAPVIAAVGAAVAGTLVAMLPAIPVILALAAAALAVGAAFLMAGAGVMLACQGLVYLLTNLTALAPAIPDLFTCAAGLMAIAVAGWALIPAMLGLIGASAGLIAMSVGVAALATSIMALVAAIKAYAAVADTAKGITDALSGAVNWLGGALSSLCFKHAVPMAEAYNKTLLESAEQTQSLTEDVDTLGKNLRALPAAEVGVAGGAVGAGAGTQYITIESPRIEIGNISSEVDLDKVTDAVSKGIAESLRRRS
jgi:hypothetical protein